MSKTDKILVIVDNFAAMGANDYDLVTEAYLLRNDADYFKEWDDFFNEDIPKAS